MAEIALSPPPRTRFRAYRLAALAAAALLVAAVVVGLNLERVDAPVARPAAAVAAAPVKPLRPEEHGFRLRREAKPARRLDPYARLGAAAARGLDRRLFVSTPGGVLVTAANVARWRPFVVRAARRNRVAPNALEGIAFVESIRRRSLGLRFAPHRSLPGIARSVRLARRRLGRGDLAVASYGIGLPPLRQAIRRWAWGPHGVPTATLVRRRGLSYAKLYFGSAPDRHAATWRRLASVSETRRDWYWQVLAAERVMRRWRHDPAGLRYEQELQLRKNSAEEVLHPLATTPRFASPRALRRAWRHRVLRAIPRDAARTHLALAASFGQMAPRLGRSRRLYRGLRPDALQLLLYIGRRVHRLSQARRPLLVTSAVRDLRYQRLLTRTNPMAARHYSLHTTGYAFDIARSYGSTREARAFQFTLDRLQALHLIAYIVEPAAIHVAVAAHAARSLRALSGDA